MNEKIYVYCQKFSQNIKNERKIRNLTQKQVAEMMGIKTQSYQAYENGVTLPSLENLLKLAIVFNFSLDEIFGIKF